MRIAFMGAPAFAATALEELAGRDGFEIAAVYSQPPRPAGRGKKLQPTATHALAERLGLPVRTPPTLRDAGAQADFAALRLDAAVVVAYGLILPQPVLDAPRLGCVNLHGSLLPRWRGAAPVQRAIMAGDAETGVCVMQMEAGLDTGPVLARAATPIGPEETAGALAARLALLGAPLLADTLTALEAGLTTPERQPDAGATYAAKIDKAEARIDWTAPAARLARLVRGLNPAPGAWTEAGAERLKILLAREEPGAGAPGALLDDRLLVACGDGRALRILRAQRPGKGAMDADELLRGFHAPKGGRLG
ncbi:methionyl-tRNA formyltransferase [Rubrimonas cliftonensis]|uniref:Methionyl-tRNA formyltransferase n=1 Tax=Rubrimonas cliftonensis TaxID=89524 RepID=A0A1H3VTM3_9RHOB|nr:methionyl-tRNA formyltransferase [Rubrimonas cliftonensis]SDZ78110.1 methionyl-tRNA formyltransferase [Rubrimonas cliftonensis]